jgi:transcriptional regulator with XRE-family HTH domain
MPMYPNLKLQIWKTGIRQNRLAQMLGMDETMLSRIVNGYRDASPELRERVAGLLHSDVAWLFACDEPQPPAGGAGQQREKSAHHRPQE